MKPVMYKTPTFKFIPRHSRVMIFNMFELQGRQEDDQKIIDYLLEHKKQNITEKDSNVFSWQTSWDSYKDHPICHGLVRDIFKMLLTEDTLKALTFQDQFWIEHNCPSFFQDSKLDECWFGIYEEGDYARQHDHGYGGISFCYYMHMENNSSPILFTSDSLPNVTGLNREESIYVNPRVGELIVFPSDLPHEVPSTTGKRITFSGNIKFNLNKCLGTTIEEILTKDIG